jgi:5-methylcytosine-specific restriction endonuclease McrA
MIIRLFKNSKKTYWHALPELPHPSSMASYLLLKHEYQKQDLDYRIRRLGVRFWLTFRNRVMSKFKKQNKGKLTCTYCGSKNLVANFNLPIPLNKKATLDHVIPRAKGGSEFSLSNLVVACSACNTKKADKRPEDFS